MCQDSPSGFSDWLPAERYCVWSLMSTLYLDIRHPWARCPLPLNGMYLTSPSLWMDSVHYRAFFEAQNWRVHPHIQLKDLCCCGPLHFYLIFFRFGLDFNQVSLFGLDLPWTPLSSIFLWKLLRLSTGLQMLYCMKYAPCNDCLLHCLTWMSTV